MLEGQPPPFTLSPSHHTARFKMDHLTFQNSLNITGSRSEEGDNLQAGHRGQEAGSCGGGQKQGAPHPRGEDVVEVPQHHHQVGPDDNNQQWVNLGQHFRRVYCLELLGVEDDCREDLAASAMSSLSSSRSWVNTCSINWNFHYIETYQGPTCAPAPL